MVIVLLAVDPVPAVLAGLQLLQAGAGVLPQPAHHVSRQDHRGELRGHRGQQEPVHGAAQFPAHRHFHHAVHRALRKPRLLRAGQRDAPAADQAHLCLVVPDPEDVPGHRGSRARVLHHPQPADDGPRGSAGAHEHELQPAAGDPPDGRLLPGSARSRWRSRACWTAATSCSATSMSPPPW